MDKEDKLFYKKLKEIQQAHKPEKWEARDPYNWKKEWGPFIKYDADWDGAYFLDLIIYKLEKMYLALDIYSSEVRESLDKNLAILKKTIDLGKQIQTKEYFEESHKFGRIHCAHVILIYREGYLHEEPIHKIIRWHKDDDEESLDNCLEDYFGTKEVNTWAKENGYNPKQLTKAYSGQWDDIKNHDIWLDMVKKEGKAEQKDIDDFFKLIAKNYRKWWW